MFDKIKVYLKIGYIYLWIYEVVFYSIVILIGIMVFL